MWLIRLAMQRPVTIIVLVLGIIAASTLAISRMKVDIFPDLNIPVVYIVQPYGGMDPSQMESLIVAHYETHFLYMTGVDYIESKSIQHVAVMKVVFRPDTDMASAMSEVVAQVQRSHAKMPPGTVDPFILRFDAGNVPVGYVVLSSPTKSVAEIEALADERIRPIVSTTPGASTPHPFGGNVRTIVISIRKDLLDSHNLSASDVVEAVNNGNLITPSGLLRAGNLARITSLNSTVEDINELKRIPLKIGPGATVLLGEVADVSDSMDIPTGWALVNGRRTVYMAVSKLASASTVDVVKRIKAALPEMRSVLPHDINVDFKFDQSIYVTEAVNGVLYECIAGAVLTGLMVLLFLGNPVSALIVVLTIPVALLAATVGLWATGQTINIMTLGGLSLSVGILVDEATVAIENIHTHLEKGVHCFRAVYDACVEVITPQLLAMLSVVSVFIPSFFMEGSTQALFVPLSLAVGFSMVASFFLANTFVPVLSGWLIKSHAAKEESEEKPAHFVDRLRELYLRRLKQIMHRKYPIAVAYGIGIVALLVVAASGLKTEIFPTGNPTSFQMRLRAPTGTTIDITEKDTARVLDVINEEAGADNVDVTMCYVGTQPPSFGISNIYMWTSGPQEAVLLVSFKKEAHIRIEKFKEKLRARLKKLMPDINFTFEAGDIVNQIMNLGAPAPIRVDISGHDFGKDRHYAEKLLAELKKLPELRDTSILQPLDYPTVDIRVDRVRAGQLGMTMADVSKALVPAMYSSRFTRQIWWADPDAGFSYQVQVQYPTPLMKTIEDVEQVPVKPGSTGGPFIRDLGKVSMGTMIGERDRHNLKRMVSITANVYGNDLGKAARDVKKAIKRVGNPPRGVSVEVRGQVPVMFSTFTGLSLGLVLAIGVIVLLLVAYFQSLRLAAAVVSVIPAVLAGVALSVHLTGITLNVQTFMGAIMAIGIGVANAILVVAFSEARRMGGADPDAAAVAGAASRLRPVLMTSIAMIAGMTPMALGLAEGGERMAPLGIAVIAGLLFSLLAVLVVLPLIFAVIQQNASRELPTMLPDDLNL